MAEKCGEECEVYSRVVGYFRPIKQFNPGKREEFKDRRNFKIGGESFKMENYYMKMAYKTAESSTCLRRKVGAVLVQGDKIVLGYNGAPKACKQCKDVGCVRVRPGTQHELCRALHAEQMILISVLKPIKESDILFCTCQPCVICAKLLIEAGLKHVVYCEEYPDKLSLEMLKEAGVEVMRI